MRTGFRTQMGRQAVAALYVLATLLLGLASSTHGASIHNSWPNNSRRQSETRLTATSTPMIDCHGATERGGAPSGTHSSCCDACALSTAPGLGARSVSHFIHQLEVSTRFAFETLLGRELDGGPADLRSRAPPALA